MADSYKDIIITPNRSNTADPKINFRGGNSTVNTAITITMYPDSNGTISFDGSAGQLFSITNDLSGLLWSVNDVSGIPSAEVYANGSVRLAEFSGNVSIGTATNSSKLFVNGNTTVNGSINVTSTAALGNTSITGFITATGDITAFFSDDRLKDRYSNIPNAIEKVKSLNGFYYEPNITAQDLGYQKEMHVGVSAQEVNAIMPEVVAPAPIDNKYMTVKYERLVPLLIEAIKEQQIQIDELKAQLNKD